MGNNADHNQLEDYVFVDYTRTQRYCVGTT
jgi:hypothetical protein